MDKQYYGITTRLSGTNEEKIGFNTLDLEREPFSHGTTYTKHLEPYAKIINQGLDGKYVPTLLDYRMNPIWLMFYWFGIKL